MGEDVWEIIVKNYWRKFETKTSTITNRFTNIEQAILNHSIRLYIQAHPTNYFNYWAYDITTEVKVGKNDITIKTIAGNSAKQFYKYWPIFIISLWFVPLTIHMTKLEDKTVTNYVSYAVAVILFAGAYIGFRAMGFYSVSRQNRMIWAFLFNEMKNESNEDSS